MAKIDQVILSAGAADATSAPVETTGLNSLIIRVEITLAASPLAGPTTLTPKGGGRLSLSTGLIFNPLPLVGGSIITTTPTGITLSNGVLTFAAVGVTTARLALAYDPKLLPQYVVWDWDYGSGDAGVALTVSAEGW